MRAFKFFNIFKKSVSPGTIFPQELMNYIKAGCSRHVSASEAYHLYTQISALGDATDTVSRHFANIKPIIKNEEDKVVENEAVSNFLKRPNTLEDYYSFAENLCTSFLLNSNAYVEVQGFIKGNPLGIYNVGADKVTITEKTNEALYIVTTTMFWAFLSGHFVLEPTIGRILSRNSLKELYHMKGFSLGREGLKALSKISSIKGDVDVLDQTLVQMVSILKKGFSAAGIFNVDTQDQSSFEQFKKDLKNRFSGAGNTGEALATRGKTVDYTPISQKNRDMQQIENKTDSRNTIYQRYNIPAPLIDQSSQTYNNYQTAQIALYDDAVLPVAQKIYTVLTKIFQDRNMLKENEFITYDAKSIPALQLRTNEELKVLKGIDILTDNELRSKASYEGYGPDGDIHYKPANLMPVGSDIFTDDNLSEPKKSYMIAMQKAGINEDDAKAYLDEYKTTISKD